MTSQSILSFSVFSSVQHPARQDKKRNIDRRPNHEDRRPHKDEPVRVVPHEDNTVQHPAQNIRHSQSIYDLDIQLRSIAHRNGCGKEPQIFQAIEACTLSSDDSLPVQLCD